MKVECFIDPSETASLNFSENKNINMSNDSLTLPAWWKCKIVSFDMNSCGIKLLPVKPHGDGSSETLAIYEQLSNSQQSVQHNKIRQIHSFDYGIDLTEMKEYVTTVPGYVSLIGRYPCAYRSFLKHFSKPVFFKIIIGKKNTQNNSVPVTVKFYCISSDVLNQIELTIYNNWQSLSQKMNIISKKTRFVLPMAIPKLESGYTETFEVLRSVVKFCIGQKGSNINEARKIPGIINIYVKDPTIVEFFENSDKSTVVTIHAETKEAALLARAKLEYVKLLFAFPYDFTGRLIGRQTRNISSVIEKTKVLSIFHDEDMEGSNEEVNTSVFSNIYENGVLFEPKRLPNEEYGAFIISGTKETVENAKIMLMIQVEGILDIIKLESQHSHNSGVKGSDDRKEIQESRALKKSEDEVHIKERNNPEKRTRKSVNNAEDTNTITKGLNGIKLEDKRGSGDGYKSKPHYERRGGRSVE